MKESGTPRDVPFSRSCNLTVPVTIPPGSPVTRPTLILLRLGVLVPFVYYGTQAAAAPFFPGFSFVGTTASEMGSTLSRHPAIFNVGIMALGVTMLLASVGFLLALRHTGVNPTL